MGISELIRTQHAVIIERWSAKVVARLRLQIDKTPQLVDDMPNLLDDLVEALEDPPESWSSASARAHARQRIKLGVDIGGLSEEIGMVAETIVELAAERAPEIELTEIATLMRLLARGAAESVSEYARLRDAQQQQQAARDFSFIAHELRTPLQSAMLGLQLLPDGPLAERLRRALQKVSELVDNRLVDARLSAQPEIRKEPVPSRELIDAALENGEALARERSIALASDDDERLVVDVDRRLIVSALTNLVVNGVKFSKPGTKVTLRARAAAEHARFEVEDACGGIPAEALPNLFQPFTQAGDDRTGFGLGLMIVKQAVEAHGGAVNVKNHPGRGCCFIIDLPRRDARSETG